MMLRDEIGREWPDGFAPDDSIAQSAEKIPWRWLFLTVFALLRGVTLDESSSFGPAGLWYLFGLAALAAFFADWAVRIRRNRQRRRQRLDDLGPLLQVLREYGVEELGGLYLYLPLPERPEDGEARAWLRVLKARQVVISGPWRLEASRSTTLASSKPTHGSGRTMWFCMKSIG